MCCFSPPPDLFLAMLHIDHPYEVCRRGLLLCISQGLYRGMAPVEDWWLKGAAYVEASPSLFTQFHAANLGSEEFLSAPPSAAPISL